MTEKDKELREIKQFIEDKMSKELWTFKEPVGMLDIFDGIRKELGE